MIINEKCYLCKQKGEIEYMAKTKITKKEALDKFQAAREKKRKCLAQLEKSMKETYKERTGKEAEKFFAL